MSWRLKRTWKRQAAIGLALLLVFVGAAWYLTSDRFAGAVRRRIISELERATGGRVEMRGFTWDLSQLEFQVEDLTIHGREPEGELPFLHVDRLLARLKIISFFDRDIALNYLGVERPVVHLIVYPDGSTNQPRPAIPSTSDKTPIETLFDLAVRRFELTSGELLLEERRIPLEFAANDLELTVAYDLLERRYDGELRLGKMDTQLQDMRPLASQASASFSLWPDAAELKALRWWTAQSQLEASGRVDDFRQLKASLTYNLSLDLREAGAVARFPELRDGRLDLGGQVSYSLAQFGVSGKLAFNNLAWADSSVQLRGVNGGARYTVDPDRIQVANLVVSALGGGVTGTAEIVNWREPEGEKDVPQRGRVDLRLYDVNLARLRESLSPRMLPVKQAVAGTADGTVSVRWAGWVRNAVAEFQLAVEQRQPAAEGAVPLTAQIRGTYRVGPGAVELAQLDVAAPGAKLEASGTVGRAGIKLDVRLQADDLAELRPLLRTLNVPPQYIGELAGQASFRGTVTGRLQAPEVAGHLEVADFVTVLPPPRSDKTPAPGEEPLPRRIAFDALTADLRYSPSGVEVRRGVLRRNGARISFEGSAGLEKNQLVPASPLAASLEAQDVSLELVQSLAGLELPLSGTASLRLRAGGTRAEPRVEGAVEVSRGRIYGEPFRSLRADLHLLGDQAQVRNLALAQDGARVTGDGAYNLDSRAFRFSLRGADFRLSEFERLQTPRARVSGEAEFEVEGSGTLQQPAINASAHLRHLVVNDERLGEVRLEAATEGEVMRLTATSRLENAKLALDGRVRLRGDFPATVTLNFSDFDFDAFLRPYLQDGLTGHSSAAGAIHLQGPLRQPRRLNVTGDISQLVVNVQNVPLRNEGPVRFTFSGQVLELESFHIVGNGTNFTARGTVDLAGQRELDLRAQGRMNLKLLQTVNRDMVSYGQMTMEATVGGTTANPSLNGRVEIAEAGVSLIDLPVALGGINGTMLFNENRLQVQKLTAETGGGQLELGGFIAYADGLRFNLTARGENIRVRYPEGVSAVADADVRFVGSRADSLLSGDVTITRFALKQRFDFALYLARSRQPTTTPDPTSPLNNIRLDVRISSSPELQVETSLAQLSGEIDLRLRGTAADPNVLGRININEGRIQFAGTQYQLRRGDITFTNPVRIEPVLDIEATARVREYDITLGFNGPLARLNTNYRSEPPLPTADIIALLAMGRTREESALSQQPTTSFTETFSSAVLGQAINTAISGRAQRLFGVSRLKIDPQVGGPETGGTAGARVTIEQQVSNEVTITYITNVARPERQIIQGEFNLTRDTSIVIVRDENGVLGFDLRIRRRKQ